MLTKFGLLVFIYNMKCVLTYSRAVINFLAFGWAVQCCLFDKKLRDVSQIIWPSAASKSRPISYRVFYNKCEPALVSISCGHWGAPPAATESICFGNCVWRFMANLLNFNCCFSQPNYCSMH